MWIVTAIGFYSVVRAPRCRVQVRARVRADLAALIRRFNLRRKTRIISTPENDYPFRIFLTTAQWKMCLNGFANDAAKCENFKASVIDQKRHNIYLDVWSVLMRLEYARYQTPLVRYSDYAQARRRSIGQRHKVSRLLVS